MAEESLTIKESIVNRFLNDILSGELNPGDKLPSEREIASRYGVSRSVVHLAFEELSHAGFIEVHPRSGNYVADFIVNGKFSTLDMLSRVNAGIYQQSYREAMIETRNLIEGCALKKIAEMNSKEVFGVLDKRMSALKNAALNSEDITEIAAELKKFHMEIIRCGNNFVSTMIMNSFYDNSTPLWIRCISFWGTERTIILNEKILAFLKEGKGDEASEIIFAMFSKYKEANAI